jgi:mannose-1-phosphate guanylyltransferase
VKALLLAAGFGTRLRPLTDHIPKCLVPIHGKPLLGYWFELLLNNGIERILVNTHYLPDVVSQFVTDSPWHDSIDLVHEDILLGTGGTILANRKFFSDEPFMVAHADNLTRFDTPAFINAHRNRPQGVEITIMTFDTDMPHTCGIVEQDTQGIVLRFHEKSASPPGNRANAAVYIFEPSVLDFLESLNNKEIDLSLEVLPNYLGRMQCFHNSDYHRDIGNTESLRLAQLEF